MVSWVLRQCHPTRLSQLVSDSECGAAATFRALMFSWLIVQEDDFFTPKAVEHDLLRRGQRAALKRHGSHEAVLPEPETGLVSLNNDDRICVVGIYVFRSIHRINPIQVPSIVRFIAGKDLAEFLLIDQVARIPGWVRSASDRDQAPNVISDWKCDSTCPVIKSNLMLPQDLFCKSLPKKSHRRKRIGAEDILRQDLPALQLLDFLRKRRRIFQNNMLKTSRDLSWAKTQQVQQLRQPTFLATDVIETYENPPRRVEEEGPSVVTERAGCAKTVARLPHIIQMIDLDKKRTDPSTDPDPVFESAGNRTDSTPLGYVRYLVELIRVVSR